MDESPSAHDLLSDAESLLQVLVDDEVPGAMAVRDLVRRAMRLLEDGSAR